MLLTLTTTHDPATDLGYLLHKHPERVQSFPVASGVAHVFYPQAGGPSCTAALLLEVDPVGLVRGRQPGGEAFSLGQYVNDRPYAASSLLAVAMARVFRTAMSGRCDARPELAASALPLQVRIPALPCRGGPALARRLFQPLGWAVTATALPLDDQFPAWGDSRYVDLRLEGTLRLAEALNHLYVLLPVVDDAKHYWVSPEEVDKLIRAGGGWLAGHPERELITRRYLAHSSVLVRTAVARLAEVDDAEAEELDNATDGPSVGEETGEGAGAQAGEGAGAQAGERGLDRPLSLARRRHDAVLAVLRAAGAHRVADLGCGDGALLAVLLEDPQFTQVVGADVSARALRAAARRLRPERMAERMRERLTLLQSSLTYSDTRLAGLDAAVLMEVIEHLDPPRLPALERAVFGVAAPGTVVVTTPNSEYNVRFEALAGGALRHRDHRFEWTREQFRAWAVSVAARYGYAVRHLPVGEEDGEVGAPTQLAVFTAGSVPAASASAGGGAA